MNTSNIVGAIVTIFITTADDAIWLIPYICSTKYNNITKIIHSTVFCISLQSVVLLSYIISKSFDLFLSNISNKENLLNIIAACIAWLIVIYLYIRKYLKQQARSLKKINEKTPLVNKIDKNEVLVNINNNIDNKFDDNNINNNDYNNNNSIENTDIITVFILSFIGALDELSYFPTLLLSKTFSFLELSIGALIATIIILIITTFFLAKCKPILDFFDSIPLYYIVSIFATIMTIQVIIS